MAGGGGGSNPFGLSPICGVVEFFFSRDALRIIVTNTVASSVVFISTVRAASVTANSSAIEAGFIESHNVPFIVCESPQRIWC